MAAKEARPEEGLRAPSTFNLKKPKDIVNNTGGKFGKFGGKYEELTTALRDYVGRETPLYFAQRLTNHCNNSEGEGPEIYLKRGDLNRGGAHKINNAIAQAMIAKRMGRKSIVAATGAGQHGVATAAAYASSEAIRAWVGNLETKYYLAGTTVGPHPCPSMVREFQSIIGKETRKQAMEKWGSGSNALGLFHEFIKDEDVRLIGVEAAGFGLDSGKHVATLTRGDVDLYHGAMRNLLQDEEGQILGPHSIGVGYVGPEVSFLKETGWAEFHTATDEAAVAAYIRLCHLEGIFPALEASHALAFLEKLCPTLPNGTKVVVNISGRGDKDAAILFQYQLDRLSD
ncbi:hypothetical protein ES319_D06G179900v1 [Gossypium barbadense]|uniref:tryptophan synthase n=2 Tax=Gossypium TaxID=3633 RepID=A0A5J5R6N4_GOSBA|nr:hypothetical protein ES319_D06G179900v1 [Gossypium barbadense]TYH67543.1 hypothetical protein ES332_D06G194600v1 [Gossypium tomentosum]